MVFVGRHVDGLMIFADENVPHHIVVAHRAAVPANVVRAAVLARRWHSVAVRDKRLRSSTPA